VRTKREFLLQQVLSFAAVKGEYCSRLFSFVAAAGCFCGGSILQQQ